MTRETRPRRLAVLAIAFAFVGFAHAGARHGHAQPPSTAPSREQALDAVDDLLRCERPHASELARYVRMLEEARATLTNDRASEAVRRDAAHSVEVLTARIRTEAEAIVVCAAPDTSSALATPTETRVEPPAALGEHVSASPPAKVRGTGTLSAESTMAAVRRTGRAFDACYDAYADRYAIERGTADLVFTTSATGVVSEVRIESLSFGDATFRGCVARAAHTLPSPGPAQGGTVETRVRLHFGPE